MPRTSFGRQEPPESEARLHIVGGDIEYPVPTKNIHDLVTVHMGRLAYLADFVGEGNLGGMPGIVNVFDHFGRFQGGFNHVVAETAVDIRDRIDGALVNAANDGFRRVVEVLDGRAFPEKFGVEGKTEILARDFSRHLFDDRPHDPARRSRRDGRAKRDDMIGVLGFQRFANLFGDLAKIAKVATAICGAWRAHAYERDIGIVNGFLGRGQGGDASGGDAVPQKVVQPRFDDGTAAFVDDLDFTVIRIDADDDMTAFGIAGDGNGADITQSEHTDARRAGG